MRIKGSRIALLIGSVLVGLIAAEGSLRIYGFSYTIAPQGIEFGWPNPQVMVTKYEIDPDLFWVTLDYREKLEQLAKARPDLIFMGDSCTEFGGYTREFLTLSRAAHGGHPKVAEELGVSGYTTFQGLRQLERDVVPLHPRVAVIYYGWNYYWLGFGQEDKQVQNVTHSRLARMESLRLAQLLVKFEMAMAAGPRSRWPSRVSPDDFRRNLGEILRLAQENGITPVLITAPTSITKGKEPMRLVKRWLNDVGDLIPLHQQYIEIVREVAESSGQPICDLAREVENLPAEERSGYFMADGIHFTGPGDVMIAKTLLRCFEADARLRAVLERDVE